MYIYNKDMSHEAYKYLIMLYYLYLLRNIYFMFSFKFMNELDGNFFLAYIELIQFRQLKFVKK